MKKAHRWYRTLAIAVSLLATCFAHGERSRTEFNAGWRFQRFGEMPDGSFLQEPATQQAPALDDSDWRSLNLPHDWGIEGPFRKDLPNRTGKLPWVGIGWYRKSFQALEADRGKRVFIDFDGAMSHAQVWLNGEYIGGWPYGYSSFRLELTKHLKLGKENILAVRLENPKESSRWYPGGGIYRNVWLVKTAPVHVAHWGTFITTPQVSAKNATVQIETVVENPSNAKAKIAVRHEIFEAGANPVKVAEQVIEKAKPKSVCSIHIESPKRWNLETPNLYYALTSVFQDGEVVDTYKTEFGIRTIEFIANKGFLLNGEVVKLKGVCLHHDLGPLGTAINTRALERQLEILKEMGCNAIRTSHNPPAPEQLALCDRMGIMVQVEAFDCWAGGKTRNDYHTLFEDWHERDLVAMVHRDRNHPSVIMWSSGNEVKEQRDDEGQLNLALSRHLTDTIGREDPTHPVSVGCNNVVAGFNGFAETLDVFGYNYKPQYYAKFRKEKPGIPLYGAETASCISSRGEYFFPVTDDKSKGCGGNFQVSSYDLFAPPWANKPDVEFAAQDKHPEVLGEFVWTGFDYLGEPTPYNKDKTNLLNFNDPEERKRAAEELERMGGTPSRSSYFGIMDLCGFKKDRFYLYQARWRPELPMVHILPHWNWPERVGEITPVHVYTSGDEAELFLNGKSLGRKKKGKYEYRLRWDDVVYQPGELKVVAYKKGKQWAEGEMKTTGVASQVSLTADRSTLEADGFDLSFITVQVSDKDGLMDPRSDHLIRFSISGPGEIIAVGNGNPASHESFQSLERKAFNGLCLVVIRSQKDRAGTITLMAESDGLQETEIQILSK